MTSIATFASAIDAELGDASEPAAKRPVQVIGVALDEGAAPPDSRLSFLVVDRDGHGRMVPAAHLTFTDDAVMPPKYG